MSVYKRPSGKWAAQVYDPATRKMRQVGTFASRRDAIEAEVEAAQRARHTGRETVRSFHSRWATDFPRPKARTGQHNTERTAAFAKEHGHRRLDIEGATALVPLYRGQNIAEWTKVDAASLDRVASYLWRPDGNGYARASCRGERIMLHHLIAGKPPRGLVVDHINGDPLDNRSENLRTVTPLVNQQNRNGADGPSLSGHRNVHWHRQREKWTVRLVVEGEPVYGGLFADKEKAIRVAAALRQVLMPGNVEGDA